MRIDFHFYATYGLARAAGFPPEKAYVIAYASQYTDDAGSETGTEEKILFEDGEEYKLIHTAHGIFKLSSVSDEICCEVWVPFHFLPGNQDDQTFYGPMIVRPRPHSKVAEQIIESFLLIPPPPQVSYTLHLFGIILHVIADTWSHQNFIGLRNYRNNISDVEIPGDYDLLKELIERFAPNLGHAQADSIPDIPFVEWEYLNYQREKVTVFNLHRATSAAKEVFDLLSRYIQNNPGLKTAEAVDWDVIENKIRELFARKGDLQECINSWKTAIASSQLGFTSYSKDLNLDYNQHEWFSAAIDKRSILYEGGERDSYTKKEGFAGSDWKLFQEAASFYRDILFKRTCELLNMRPIIDYA